MKRWRIRPSTEPLAPQVVTGVLAGVGTPQLAAHYLAGMHGVLHVTFCTVFAVGASGRIETVSAASSYGSTAERTAERYVAQRFDLLDPHMVWLAGRPLPRRGAQLWLGHHRGDELAALRDYRVGDPRRHIAWKSSARHENLLVKDFEQPQSRPQWQLDWRQLGGMENEARIARLARWVDEAEAQRCSYSLWLPGDEIASSNGPLHYARCMNALAQLP